MHRKAMVLLTVVQLAAVARASDIKTTLSVVPDNTLGMVCVPSIQGLDNDLQMMITKLELQQMVPPEIVSVANLLRDKFSISEGLDKNGTLLVALIEPQGDDEKPQSASYGPNVEPVLFIPASDPRALVQSMKGEEGEGGVWSVPMGGSTYFAAFKSKYVVFAEQTAILKEATREGKAFVEKLKDNEWKVFEGLDLALWFDGGRLFPMLKPQIEGFMGMAMMMQADPAAAPMMENTKKEIDIFLDGTDHVTFGVTLDSAGVGLRAFLTSKAGTEMSKRLKAVKVVDGSLLDGLPRQKFLYASGQELSSGQAEQAAEQVGMMLNMLSSIGGAEAAAGQKEAIQQSVDVMKEHIADLIKMVSGQRTSLVALPPEQNQGLVGLSIILKTSDSEAALQHLEKLVDTVKKMKGDSEEVKQLQDAMAFTREAEEIAGAAVHHLKLNLTSMDTLEDDEIEEILKVIGKDGALIRLAAIDPQKLVFAFGGGQEHLQKLIEHARTSAAPLAEDSGIQKVASHLPKQKASVAYISLDQTITLIRNVQRALEQDPLPIELGDLNAPLAASMTGGGTWGQIELFLPTDLLVAGKKIIMTLFAAPTPPGAAPAAGQQGPQ